METDLMEKCMLEPVSPLMKGQSQAITPKKLPLYSSKLPPSIYLYTRIQ